jgi:hypothetical protein
MSEKELTTQIEELKRTNQDLQDRLKVALGTIEVYAKQEVDALIASITDKSEVPDEDLKGKSVVELKAIDAILDKAKLKYKPVQPGLDEEPSSEATKLTVGRWDVDTKQWVN